MLFANEDGPYDDSVTQGQFEYIGEGLEGDQSKDSPGNSALIDAVSSGFPIYFFYSETNKPEWEYQGQVYVVMYSPKERSGQKVLIFDVEYQETDLSLNERTLGAYLVPVNDHCRDKFLDSVEKPLKLMKYDEIPPQLAGIDTSRIWATTETDAQKNKQLSKERSPVTVFYSITRTFSLRAGQSDEALRSRLSVS